MTETVRIRPMTAADGDFVVREAQAEGWAFDAAWVRIHLQHDAGGCLIAEANGAPIAFATAIRYGDTAWLGNLLVLPPYRRRGIAARLFEARFTWLRTQGVQRILLEAEAGRAVYERAGFHPISESPRFLAEAGTLALTGKAKPVEPLTSQDLPAVIDLDRRAFGAPRERLLAMLLGESHTAVRLKERGRLLGYAIAMPMQIGLQLGPCVATSPRAARALLKGLVAQSTGTLAAAVPGNNPEALQLFAELGFAQHPSAVRMVWGPPAETGEPKIMFALAGGAVG